MTHRIRPSNIPFIYADIIPYQRYLIPHHNHNNNNNEKVTNVMYITNQRYFCSAEYIKMPSSIYVTLRIFRTRT